VEFVIFNVRVLDALQAFSRDSLMDCMDSTDSYPEIDGKLRAVRVEIWDKDKVSKDDFMYVVASYS
jgi:hypothetical protein